MRSFAGYLIAAVLVIACSPPFEPGTVEADNCTAVFREQTNRWSVQCLDFPTPGATTRCVIDRSKASSGAEAIRRCREQEG